jgi:hypothetical protein
VGFGHGRAPLELAWRLRDREVIFHGVDVGYKSAVQTRGVARTYGIVPEPELDQFQLPFVYLYDATRLHFPEDSLDVVFSAVTIRFIRDKGASHRRGVPRAQAGRTGDPAHQRGELELPVEQDQR